MEEDKASISTGGGAYIQGDVFAGGDFIGRDKVEQLIQHMEQTNLQGDYIAHQEINIHLKDVDASQAFELLVSRLAAQLGLDKGAFQELGQSAPTDHVNRQVEELQAAQREATAQGVSLTPEAAFTMGMLAAYRRDYRSAKDYFQQAIEVQAGAMQDLTQGDYTGAMQRLEVAQSLVRQTDPLDANALALRGFIEKTMAQLCNLKGDQTGEKEHYTEAKRLFEGAVQLDPANASAYNGLANLHAESGDFDAAIEV